MFNPNQVRVETNYEYRNGLIGLQSDIEAKNNILVNNFLEFSSYFESGRWSDSELNWIATQLEETGKYFAKLQGFSDGPSSRVNFNGSEYITASGTRFNTGNLVNHIKAERKGTFVQFYNDAVNARGQPYAGHMEYGFHDRGGNFIPARPFMRPAFYAVSQASKGRMTSILKNLLERTWRGDGFSGISNIDFGHRPVFYNKQYSVAGKMQNFYGRGSQKRLKQVRSDKFRRSLSARQGKRRNSKEARTASVKRDSKVNVRNNQGHLLRKERQKKMRRDEYGWYNPQGYKGGSKYTQDMHRTKHVFKVEGYTNPIGPIEYTPYYYNPIGPVTSDQARSGMYKNTPYLSSQYRPKPGITYKPSKVIRK